MASAIIDDTVGWTIIAMTSGLALHGVLNATTLAQSVLGTGLFLLVSFTLGRRLVFALIRWTNDTFVSEVPVVTAILIVMGTMALVTHLIGIHTVLGAFVAGILVGESPILTQHINEQLRGLLLHCSCRFSLRSRGSIPTSRCSETLTFCSSPSG